MNRRAFLLGGGAILAARPHHAEAREQVLRIAYPDQSPPNSWEGEDGRMRGVMVDLMSEVADAVGYRLEPLSRPLTRVQAEVESGAADGMCLVVTPARLEYAVASSEPLWSGPVTIFVRRDNPALNRLEKVETLDDLAKADVSVVAIYGNGWIKKNIESRGIRTEHADGTVATVRMLLGKRGDVVVDMSSQINWILKDMPDAAEVVELPAVMERVGWHLLIGKKSSMVRNMAQFNRAIAALKASPRYADLLGRYGVRA